MRAKENTNKQKRQRERNKNSKILVLIQLIVMQGYLKEKIRTHLDLLSIPQLWGKKQTQDTRDAWDTTQFLEFKEKSDHT